MNETTNNVWGTILKDVGGFWLESEKLKASRASAAPAGVAAVAPAPANPFAGFWSSFPSNDTKGQYQNATPFSFASINPLWIVLLGALGLLLVFVRR